MSQGDVTDDSDCSSDNEQQSNDADGIWSPDIEQSFLEALAIYPPCGRRKIILSEEGKMYGRNELIARYIKLRTGKTRTRKQVSSHIQVLARRKSKEIQANVKDQTSKERIVQSLSSMSSSQIVSATALQEKTANQNNGMAGFLNSRMNPNQTNSLFSHLSQYSNNEASHRHYDEQQQQQQSFHNQQHFNSSNYQQQQQQQQQQQHEIYQQHVPFVWNQNNLKLVKYQAYVQSVKNGHTSRHNFIHIGNDLAYDNGYMQTVSMGQLLDKFPDIPGGLPQLLNEGPCNSFYLVKCWADLNTDLYDCEDVFYGVSSEYEGRGNMAINISTKVCSFGKQVVEKVEADSGLMQFDVSPLSSPSSSSSSPPGVALPAVVYFRNDRSCMCEYMVSFINKLRKLPERYMMNSVLENFTVIQVVRNNNSNEILLCLAFTFEVAELENESQRIVYQIVK